MKPLRWSVLLLLVLAAPLLAMHYYDSSRDSWYWIGFLDREEISLLLQTQPALLRMHVPSRRNDRLSLNGTDIPYSLTGVAGGAAGRAGVEAAASHAKNVCFREKVSFGTFQEIAVLLNKMNLSGLERVFGENADDAPPVGMVFLPSSDVPGYWYHALDGKAPAPPEGMRVKAFSGEWYRIMP